MNNGTKQTTRKEVIARCAAALETLQKNPSARQQSRAHGKVYAATTRTENEAVKGLLGERGQDLFDDVSERFLSAVKARCSAAVVQSVEDTYYYWKEELAERWAS
jgi:hypothetical protein